MKYDFKLCQSSVGIASLDRGDTFILASALGTGVDPVIFMKTNNCGQSVVMTGPQKGELRVWDYGQPLFLKVVLDGNVVVTLQ